MTLAHLAAKRNASDQSVRRGWLRRLSFAHQQLIIVLSAILPLLLLAMLLLVWGVQEHRRVVERGLSDTARALGIAVDEQIITWRSALEALSTSESFDDGDFSGFYKQALAVAEQHEGGIVVFDETLAQVLNTRRPYGEPLPPAAYPEPVRRTFATGEPQVSGPFIGVVARHWLVSLDVPVKRAGRTIYSLNISFHPARISDLLEQERLPRGRVVHVINDENQFVARSERAADMIGQAVPAWYADAIAQRDFGVVEGPSPAGGPEQILAFQRLNEAPWTLAVAAPKAAVAAAWREPIWLFGALAVLTVLVSGGLARLFSRRVTEPIGALAGAAEDVLAGRAAQMEPLKIPEFETLRQALARAAAAARERIAAEERAAAAEATAEEMRQSEERQRLLAQEVDHRAKNLLAVVQSLLQQTRADDIESYIAAASGRIMALARSHSLIAASRWRGADLAHIVEDELAPFRAREGRASHRAHVEVSGQLVSLRPAAAQSLAIAVHELTTNAVKYGALSSSDGRISVSWQLTEKGLLLLWNEAGGPPIAGPPERHGFGTKIIAAGIEHQLDGRVTFDWRPEGLLVSILVPSEQLAAGSAVSQREDQSTSAALKFRDRAASLTGRRILVIEDEALIAGQIESLLVEQGCLVSGPVRSPEHALALARSEPLDAAILDVNLSGSRSESVADMLRQQGIPFIVLTGYADSGLSAAFQGAPILAKPFEEEVLVSLLSREIAEPSAATGRPDERHA